MKGYGIIPIDYAIAEFKKPRVKLDHLDHVVHSFSQTEGYFYTVLTEGKNFAVSTEGKNCIVQESSGYYMLGP